MTEMTDEEWQRLHVGFDTRRLLDAIGEVDTLRSHLSDDGLRPPAIRDRLFTLHELAMAVVNDGSQHRAQEFFDLALEWDDEVFDMLEAVTRLHETLSTLTELRPESLDDDDGEDEADDGG